MEIIIYIASGILSFLSIIYLGIIAPILFRLVIIPKIEKRYNIKLKLHNPRFISPTICWWGVPPLEISFYLFYKLMNWERLIRQYHRGSLILFKDFDYDIKTASRLEIIMSYITVFFMVYFAIMSILCIIMKYYSYNPLKD